jgi:hypothetical protein
MSMRTFRCKRCDTIKRTEINIKRQKVCMDCRRKIAAMQGKGIGEYEKRKHISD